MVNCMTLRSSHAIFPLLADKLKARGGQNGLQRFLSAPGPAVWVACHGSDVRCPGWSWGDDWDSGFLSPVFLSWMNWTNLTVKPRMSSTPSLNGRTCPTPVSASLASPMLWTSPIASCLGCRPALTVAPSCYTSLPTAERSSSPLSRTDSLRCAEAGVWSVLCGFWRFWLVCLLRRCSSHQAAAGGIMDASAVQFCARKVSAVSGDARKALDICR